MDENGKTMVCKLFKDFTELEQRYLEALVDETIMKKGINVTEHCLHRLKQRNYSLGKLQYSVRQGKVIEIQFDETGCKVLLSFASGSQFGKGYTSYTVYDLQTGYVVSAWQKQKKAEKKLDTKTYIGYKQYLKRQESIIHMVSNSLNYTVDDFKHLVFKYDRRPLNPKTETKWKKFMNGEIDFKDL